MSLRLRSLALLPLVAALAGAAAIPLDTTPVLELAGEWDYAPAADPPPVDALPAAWQRVRLPHTQGQQACGLYRVAFPVPALWFRERVAAVVRVDAGVVRAWLNGQALGARRATALDARFDVTDQVRRGAVNTLLVAVSTPGASRRGRLEGARLEATGAAAATALAATPRVLANGALLDVHVTVSNRALARFEGRVELALEPVRQAKGRKDVWRRRNDVNIDPDRSQAVRQVYEVQRPQLWRFDNPALYRLTLTLRRRRGNVLLQTLVRHVGFRCVEVADGRWLASGEWVRLAGIAFRAPGATLLCAQPGQAAALAQQLAKDAPGLPALLDVCDREGVVAWLDAPADAADSPGARESLGALARLATHPCVWGWVVGGSSDAYAAAAARLRELAPRVPVGRPLPELGGTTDGFDFVVSRFETEAIAQDTNNYGRRLDDVVRDSGGVAVAVVDTLQPAAPGDRDSILGSLKRRRDEAARRFPIAALFFDLPRDEALYRGVENRLGAFSFRPPRHEGRRDKKAFILKSHFESGVSSPVVARMPAYSLAGYQVAWRASAGADTVASGSIPAATVRPWSIEGRAPAPLRVQAQWKLPKPSTVLFTAELQDAAGRVVAVHRASLKVSPSGKDKVKVEVGPPPKPEPTPAAPAAPVALIRPGAAVTLDLAKLFNNDAISTPASKKDGNFDLPKLEAGSSYPADKLPKPNAPFAVPAVANLVFRFPDTADGKPNNLRCDGQRLDVPAGRYSALWLLAAADAANQEATARLLYDKGEEPVAVGVSDWCGEAAFGEAEAVRSPERHTWKGEREKKLCRIWAVRLPVRPEPLKAVLLPKNGHIHLFAATLIKATAVEAVHVPRLPFNNDGISWRSDPFDGNFDLPGQRQGDSFIADLLPKSGASVALPGDPQITFRFPSKDNRHRNNVLCDGQAIAMPDPPAAFDALWFLGAAHDGDNAGALVIEYEDGEAKAELRLADWCAKPTHGELDVLRVPARHTVQGEEEKIDNGLVAWRVPLDPTRKLKSIALPRERTLHVFAITLARAKKE